MRSAKIGSAPESLPSPSRQTHPVSARLSILRAPPVREYRHALLDDWYTEFYFVRWPAIDPLRSFFSSAATCEISWRQRDRTWREAGVHLKVHKPPFGLCRTKPQQARARHQQSQH